MHALVLVALGAMAGGLARYGVTFLLLRTLGPGMPWGTLTVNITGCLAIGLVSGLTAGRGEPLALGARLFLVTGFLGAYTTFSAFGIETVEMLRGGATARAILNIGGQNILSLGAVWLGLAAARWLG